MKFHLDDDDDDDEDDDDDDDDDDDLRLLEKQGRNSATSVQN